MKTVKLVLSLVLLLTFSIGTVSASGQKVGEKQFHGLAVLNETTGISYLEDGTKVTTIRKELEGGIEDLENIIREEEKRKLGKKILAYNQLNNDLSSDNNIGTYNIPTAEEARSWNSNNLMIQLVGHNGMSLKILDFSWTVLADVVTYHTAFPGKTVTDLKTKPRLQVNSYGIVGGTELFYEQTLLEAPVEGTSSASHNFSAHGGGAFVYVSAYIGGMFSYKSGTTTYSGNRWWDDPGYTSS